MRHAAINNNHPHMFSDHLRSHFIKQRDHQKATLSKTVYFFPASILLQVLKHADGHGIRVVHRPPPHRIFNTHRKQFKHQQDTCHNTY